MLTGQWVRSAVVLVVGVGGALLVQVRVHAAQGRPPAAAAPGRRAAGRVRRNSHVRFWRYHVNRVYPLQGRVGYEIDLQFAPGEHFVGLGVGDAKGVTVASAGDHLFIKPRAVRVATDLTVLTNRRSYLFDYRVGPSSGKDGARSALYAVRFEYPRVRTGKSVAARNRRQIAHDLAVAERAAPRNEDYWYCGAPSLKPSAAWDDGIETHLVFPPQAELPAVYALNADGGESLVNFDMRGDQMVIHRVARRFVLKRGRLTGCVVNRGYAGSRRRMASETLSRQVWRITRRPRSTAPTSGRPGGQG